MRALRRWLTGVVACILAAGLEASDAQESRHRDDANEWVVQAFSRHHVDAELALVMMRSVHPDELASVVARIYAACRDDNNKSEDRFESVMWGLEAHGLERWKALAALGEWYGSQLRGRSKVALAFAKHAMEVWPCCDESTKRVMIEHVVKWCDEFRSDAGFKGVMERIGRVLAVQGAQPASGLVTEWMLNGPEWIRPYAIQWGMSGKLTNEEQSKLANAYWERNEGGRLVMRIKDEYSDDVARIVSRTEESRLRAEGLCIAAGVSECEGVRRRAYLDIVGRWYECIYVAPDLIRLAAEKGSIECADAAVWVVKYFVRSERIRRELGELEAAIMDAISDAEALLAGKDGGVKAALGEIRRMLNR